MPEFTPPPVDSLEDERGNFTPPPIDSLEPTLSDRIGRVANKIGIPTSWDDIRHELDLLGLTQPSPVQLPRFADEPVGSPVDQAIQGALNLPADVWNFATSPGGVAIAGVTAGAAPLVQRAIALGFTADQIRSGMQSGNLGDQVEAALGAGMTLHGAIHSEVLTPKGKGEFKPPPKDTIEPEQKAMPASPEEFSPPPVEAAEPAPAAAPSPQIVPPEVEQMRNSISDREQILAQSQDPEERRQISSELVDLRGQLGTIENRYAEQAAFELAWTAVPNATRDRMLSELRDRGVDDEQIATMTPADVRNELAKPLPSTKEFAPAPPREEQPLSEEEIARREYQDQLRQQYEEDAGSHGDEFLQALEKIGGLPTPGSESALNFHGELRDLESLARNPSRTDKTIRPNKLFSTDARSLDTIATDLRDRGFDVQTPSDVISFANDRLRTGRKIYGNPARETVMASRAKEELNVALEKIDQYVRANGSANPEQAARDIGQIFAESRDRSSRQYQPELFETPRRPGAPATARGVPEDVAKALKVSDLGAAKRRFERGNTISSILPKLISREIPGFDIAGKVINSPRDFALLTRALRTPHFESYKVAFLDRNNRVVHSQILHVGALNETIAESRSILKAFQDAKEKGKAVGVILSHNHPSGDPTPSSHADIPLGKKLEKVASQAGLKVVDQIITDGDRYYSQREGGIRPYDEAQPLAAWEVVPRDELKKIGDSETYKEAAQFFRQANPNATHVFYATTRHTLTAVERVPNNVDLVRSILNGAAREGAYGVWVDLAPALDPSISLEIRKAMHDARITLLDMSTRNIGSFREAQLIKEIPAGDYGVTVSQERPEEFQATHAMGATAPHRAPKTLPPSPTPIGPTNVAAAAQPVASWWKQRTLGMRKLFAPQSIDAPARMVANIIRDYNGKLANTIIQADHALTAARKDFDRTPVPRNWTFDPNKPLPRNYAFVDNSERGGIGLSGQDRQLKTQLDKMFAEAVDEVHRVKPQALQSLIQDYFPHIWEDPEQAKRVFAEIISKRPLEGPRGFLKKRVLEYTIDGLKAGLRPVSDNPIDMALTKLHEVHRFVAAQDILSEAKAIGARKFVYVFERPPDGWTRVDDPTSTVHGPPFVTVPEAFDEQLRAKTTELLQKLGVPHERVAALRGNRWGEASNQGQPPGAIRTRFAGPMSVYWHELGHVLQYRYGWLDQIAYDAKRTNLGGKSEIEKQLRALADLRIPDAGAAKHFKQYIRTKDEKSAVILEAYLHAPERMKQVAPNVYGRVKKFIAAHPELHGIEQIRPNVALGGAKAAIPVGGMVTLGHWYMPEGAAQVLSNYLSPGLQRFGIIRSIRQSTNILSGLQLGFSAFHAGFTSIDAAVSQFALGLRYLSEGKPLQALEKIVATPVAPVTNYLTGRRVQRAMLEPAYGTLGIRQIADLAVQSGLRATVDPFWRTQITRNMLRAWHEGGVKGYAGTVLRLPFAASEQLMRPILEYLVPRQKLGVFAGMALQHMERLGPNADIHAVRDAMAQAADATEDRMGQMTYDNLFYNRVIRDTALLGFRAYGWTFGKYRALFGGVSDVVQTPGRIRAGGPVLTDRMAYLIALPMVAAGIGSLMNYSMTGQPPQDWKDAIMPRTGKLDRHGNPQRLSLPTYMKDLLSDWHDFPNPKKMFLSFYHKLNPWLDVAVNIIQNADFYGTKIYNEDDPAIKQAGATVAYAAKAATPFSVTGAARLADSHPSLMQQVLPFFGFVPAKQELSMTRAQLRASELYFDTLPRGARSPDKAEQSQLISQLMRDMKAQDPSWQPQLEKLLSSGQLQPNQLGQLFRSLPLNPLQYQVKKLDVDDAMKVWDLADPNERDQIRPQLLEKVFKSRTLLPSERARFMQLLMQSK